MSNLGWIIYAVVVLVVSGLIGMHLGRFREAYTEMTGMMAGMTMGMLNGFVLGYAAGAATSSMFWGNLIGVVLGLSLGAYYGRAGSLMGILDGGMGGVMGGSMGAMLAVMIVFPKEGLIWTAVLLAVIYIVGMAGLVVLIEQSAPDHAALHRLMPVFTRAVAIEAAEEADRSGRGATSRRGQPTITDYYALLGLRTQATVDELNEAYLAKLSVADQAEVERLERAIATLSDPNRRRAYDARLRSCCPPPKKAVAATQPVGAAVAATVAATVGATATASSSAGTQSQMEAAHPSNVAASPAKQKKLVDYYALLSVPRNASEDDILEAYLEKTAEPGEVNVDRLERAVAVLTDPQRREAYDQKLRASYATEATPTKSTPAQNGRATLSPRAQQTVAPAQAAPGVRSSEKGITVSMPVQNTRSGRDQGLTTASRTGGGAGATMAMGGGKPANAAQIRTPQPQGATLGKSTGKGHAPGSRSNQTGRGSKQGKTGGQRQGEGRGQGQRRTAQQQVRYARADQAEQQQHTVISMSWVGGLVTLLVFLALGWWALNAGAARTGGPVLGAAPNAVVGAAGETQAQLEQQAVVATLGADGKQTVDVVLNSATFQYEPKVVKVKQGLPARFNLSAKNGDPG